MFIDKDGKTIEVKRDDGIRAGTTAEVMNSLPMTLVTIDLIALRRLWVDLSQSSTPTDYRQLAILLSSPMAPLRSYSHVEV